MTIRNMQTGFELLEILTNAAKEISEAMGSKYDKSPDFQLTLHECEDRVTHLRQNQK